MDIILALMGSLLFAFAGLPVYWFFALFLYSIAVVARCYFTLKRKKYTQILTNRGIRIRQWYTKALDERWHNLVVKNVLGGWIVSHVFIGMYSLIVFILFNTYFDKLMDAERLWVLSGALIIVFILTYLLAKISYRFGPKICNMMNV